MQVRAGDRPAAGRMGAGDGMKVRLMGLPGECGHVVDVLRDNPDVEVVEVSPARPNRGDSQQVRVYIDLRIRRPTDKAGGEAA